MVSPGRGDGLGQVGQPLLRPQRRDDLGLRVQLHPEAAVVIAGQRLAQAGDALAHGIAMGARVLHRLDQLGDDMRRRRAVRVAHAEIDDVLCRCPCLGLGRVHLGEHVGRQAADAVEFLGHRLGSVRWARALAPMAGGAARRYRAYRPAKSAPRWRWREKPGSAGQRRRAEQFGRRRGGRLGRHLRQGGRRRGGRRWCRPAGRAAPAWPGLAGASVQGIAGAAARAARRAGRRASANRPTSTPDPAGARHGDAAQHQRVARSGAIFARAPVTASRNSGEGRSGRGGMLARLGDGRSMPGGAGRPASALPEIRS